MATISLPMETGARRSVDENLSLIEGFHDAYSVRLENFEGPLDLLLHLIRKNELDIQDIPISLITRQYLEYLKVMKELNLEVAGDFLLMAATLLHIKSRNLLPQDEPEEEGEEENDPKAELIRRLLEYQQYKEAGQVLGARALLGRDLFVRARDPELAAIKAQAGDGPIEADLFMLVEAFRSLLARVPVESFHDVAAVETFSIADSISEILSLLQERTTLLLEEAVGDDPTRERIIVTFLATLELCRLKMIRVFQNDACGSIHIVPAVREEAE